MANPEDLGRYDLKRLLGRGALGQVWEATERDTDGTRVAVKIMHAADEELTIARVQFAREARLAALLRHPNVVRVHDSGEAAGTSFMVMEMVEGRSLRKHMAAASSTVEEKLRWLRQIGEGIAAMHTIGIVHRDLKPENVIIRPDGSACIVDLGIAKWRKFDLGGERDPMEIEEPLSAPPASNDFAPPEAIESHLYDELGDQYAWGALAYALLMGEPPYEGAPTLTKQDGISAAVASAIERARARKRKARWEAMEDLLEALDGTPPSKPPPPPAGGGISRTATTDSPPPSEGGGADAAPESPNEKAEAKRSPLMLAGAAAAVLIALVGLILAGLR